MSIETDGMTEREKLIREGFAFDSDRDCEAAKYLIGVIDTIRWDRKLLRERIADLETKAGEAETLRVAFITSLNETALFCKRVMDEHKAQAEHATRELAETQKRLDPRFCIGCAGRQAEQEREFDKDCPCGGGFMTADGAVRFLLSRLTETRDALVDEQSLWAALNKEFGVPVGTDTFAHFRGLREQLVLAQTLLGAAVESRTAAERRVAGMRTESDERAQSIRNMVPDYMKMWAPLDAVRVLVEERAKAQKDTERMNKLEYHTGRSDLPNIESIEVRWKQPTGCFTTWQINRGHQPTVSRKTLREAIDATYPGALRTKPEGGSGA